MAKSHGEPSNISERANADEPRMNAERLALIRHRLAMQYYDQQMVIDRIARAIHLSGEARIA
jgi:hypothetical protein